MSEVVGKVAIKVWPDARDFKRDLERQLKDAVRDMRQKIKLDVDKKHLKDSLKRAAKDATKGKYDISVEVNETAKRRMKRSIEEAAEDAKPKVDVDLDLDWDDDVKRALRRIKKDSLKLKAELSTKDVEARLASLESLRPEIEIDLDLDWSDDIASALAGLETLRPEIEVDLDMDWGADIAAAMAAIQAATPDIDIEANTTPLLSSFEAAAARIRASDLEVKLDLDMDWEPQVRDALKGIGREEIDLDFDADFDRVNGELEAWLRTQPKVKLDTDVDVSRATATLAFWRARMSALKVRIEVDDTNHRNTFQRMMDAFRGVNNSSRTARRGVMGLFGAITGPLTGSFRTLNRVGSAALSGVAEGFGRLVGIPPQIMANMTNFVNILAAIGMAAAGALVAIPAISLAIANLSTVLIAAVGNVLAFINGLASMWPVVLGLPGALGGMAVGAGLTYVAFSDLNKQLPGVVQRFKDLKSVITENFWDQARTPIREFANDLLPLLREHLEGSSTALGDFFAALSTSFKGILNPALETMFNNLDESIQIASQHTDDFAKVISELGMFGTSILPGIAEEFGNMANQFGTWLEEARKSGELAAMFERGWQAVKDFAAGVWELIGAVGALGRAADMAEPGTPMENFRKAMEGLHDTVSSPGFQEKLTNVFKAANEGLDGIAKSGPSFKNFMSELSTALTSILPDAGEALGTLFTSIFDGLSQPGTMDRFVQFWDDLRQGVEDFAPHIPGIVDGVSKIAEGIGEFMASSGGSAGQAFETIATALGNIAQALGDFSSSEFGKFTISAIALATSVPIGIMGGIASSISAIATAMGEVVSADGDGAFGTALAAVSNLAPPVAAYNGFNLLRDVITGVADDATGTAENLIISNGKMDGAVLRSGGVFSDWAVQVHNAFDKARTTLAVTIPGPKVIPDPIGNAFGFAAQWAAQYAQGVNVTVPGPIVKPPMAGPFSGIAWATLFMNQVATGLNQKPLKPKADTKEAEDKIKGLGKTVDDVNGKKGTIKVKADTNDATTRLREITRVTASIEKIDARIKITADVGSAVKSISGVSRILSNFSKAKVEAKVDVDTGDAESGVAKAKAAVEGFSRVVGKAKAELQDNATAAIKKVQDLLNAYGNTTGRGTAALSDQASGGIGAVRSALDSLNGKTAHTYVYNHTINTVETRRTSSGGGSSSTATSTRELAADGKRGGKAFGEAFLNQVDKAFNKMDGLLAKVMEKAKDKGVRDFWKRQSEGVKEMYHQFAPLFRKFEEAKQKLADLMQERKAYFEQVRDAIIATGDPTQFGAQSYKGIVKSMRLARDEAKRFARVLAKLKKAGLNDEVLAQIVAAGPQEGLAVAEEILRGGVDQINKLHKDISKYAKDIGGTAADAAFEDAIKKAEDTVKTMLKLIEPLGKALARAVDRLIKQLEKKLKQLTDKGKNHRDRQLELGVNIRVNDEELRRVEGRMKNRKVTARANTVQPAVQNILHYHAAPGESFTSEQALFDATFQGRAIFA